MDQKKWKIFPWITTISCAKKVKDVKEAIDFVQKLKSDPDFKHAKKAIKHVTLAMRLWKSKSLRLPKVPLRWGLRHVKAISR